MAVNVGHIISVFSGYTDDKIKEAGILSQVNGIRVNYLRGKAPVSIPTVTRKAIVMVLDFMV